MSRTISIEPVTRIEGHARITLQLADTGEVEDAKFHLTQFRGFEKFCEGRPYREMPALTARTCGICPVSHLLSSNKACDDLLAVTIPPTAEKLRRIMNLGQLVQSHALSFFHLSSPDLLLGWDSDPVKRNIFGVMKRTRSWPRTASGCARSARPSSRSWAARRSIPPGSYPAASTRPSPKKSARPCWR